MAISIALGLDSRILINSPPDAGIKNPMQMASETNYLWEHKYYAAVLEDNPALLPARIADARDVMQRRLLVLKPFDSIFAMAEYRAIRDAQSALRTLEKLNRRNQSLSGLVLDNLAGL